MNTVSASGRAPVAAYLVGWKARAPSLDADWADAAWADVPALEVGHFRPESSSHRPRTQLRLVYSAEGLSGVFRVEDRYVRCVRTAYQSEVWKDSCVECFLSPKPDRGYFNFEFNCGGAYLCCHITDPVRTPDGFKAYTRLPAEVGRLVQARGSLPSVVEPEITSPVAWTLRFFIPFRLFERYVGGLSPVAGQTWRANFFKCAEENSHPHWAAWSPVDEFNFHLPRCFGEIRFASPAPAGGSIE